MKRFLGWIKYLIRKAKYKEPDSAGYYKNKGVM